MASVDEMTEKILYRLSLDPRTRELAGQVLERLVGDLPASADHQHRTPGGLVQHLLAVAANMPEELPSVSRIFFHKLFTHKLFHPLLGPALSRPSPTKAHSRRIERTTARRCAVVLGAGANGYKTIQKFLPESA